MLDERFKSSKYAYRVKISDMTDFLKDCDELGYHWLRGGLASTFNPFKFYEGDKMEYIRPLQKIEDPNYVFIRCFNGHLDFSFEHNWFFNPVIDYKGEW